MAMKKWKKWSAVGLVLAMLMGTLAACGSKAPAEESSKPAEKTETAQTSEKTEEKAEEKTEEAKEFSYPMEGGREISLFSMRRAECEEAGIMSYSDTRFAEAVEEATGIKLNWTHPSATTGQEAFNLFVTNGDYTDIIELNTSYYNGGTEALFADGVIIELTDVIDQYMPNVKAWMEANPKAAEEFYSPDGKIYALPYIYEEEEQTFTTGLYLRSDWLEELGLKVPTTIDEWHDVLVAFKESKGVIPYTVSGSYLTDGSGFGHAFAPKASSSVIVDPETGKLVYSRIQDYYREYLTLLHDWNEEGLIDPDALSLDGTTANAKIASGEAGASWGWNADVDHEDVPLVAAPVPAKEAGAEVYTRPAARVSVGWVGCITTQCEDVEAAARYLDYIYGEEGRLLANFGIEGESYEMVDGMPVFTELITNNPDGLSVTGAKANYVRIGGYPGFVTYDSALMGLKTDAAKDSFAVWSQGVSDYTLSESVKPAADKQDRANTIKAELNTYYQEMAAKFFLGSEDIRDDAVWNEYVETMKTMGADEFVSFYQESYDQRYGK